MRELYAMVLSALAALLLAEVIRQLFPEKSGALVHGLAVLSVVVSLVFGVLHSDLSLEFSVDFTPEETAPYAQELYADKGAALLSERLYTILDAAGVAVQDGAGGIEVQYTQNDALEIEIEAVVVRLMYGADPARASAVLRGVLTDAVPIQVYVDDR